MASTVPRIEITYDADAPCVGRPDAERGAFDPFVDGRMGAELVVELPVSAFSQQVLVHLPKHRPKAVGIFFNPFDVASRKFEPVGEPLRFPGYHPREKAFDMNPLKGSDGCVLLIDYCDRRGCRQESVDQHRRAVPTMHAEHRKGVAVTAAHDRFDVHRISGAGIAHEGSPAIKSRRPRSGIPTHEGRFASS
jgi:hypothetical protein